MNLYRVKFKLKLDQVLKDGYPSYFVANNVNTLISYLHDVLGIVIDDIVSIEMKREVKVCAGEIHWYER